MYEKGSEGNKKVQGMTCSWILAFLCFCLLHHPLFDGEMTMKKGASVSAAMVDRDQEEAAPTTANMSSKKELLSTALKRTSEWFASFLFVLSKGCTGFVLSQ